MRVSVPTLAFVIACSCWNQAPAAAQGEKYGYEITASVWPLTPSGNVLSHGTTTDFRSDLGIESRVHPMFKGVIKIAEKHGFTAEFVPYRFDGENTLTKSFHLNGQTFPAQDTIRSTASVNYIFGGYQYDLVSKDRGDVQVIAGVAYFGASISAQSRLVGTASEDRKEPLPIAGARFRIFPFHGDTFNINGEVKGMSYGDFGHYINPSANAALAVSPHVRLQAGFNFVDADGHATNGTKGFKLRFVGPIFSLQVHD